MKKFTKASGFKLGFATLTLASIVTFITCFAIAKNKGTKFDALKTDAAKIQSKIDSTNKKIEAIKKKPDYDKEDSANNKKYKQYLADLEKYTGNMAENKASRQALNVTYKANSVACFVSSLLAIAFVGIGLAVDDKIKKDEEKRAEKEVFVDDKDNGEEALAQAQAAQEANEANAN